MSHAKNVGKGGSEASSQVFLNIYFHDFLVKNYLILYAKQNKSGSESSVSCLK